MNTSPTIMRYGKPYLNEASGPNICHLPKMSKKWNVDLNRMKRNPSRILGGLNKHGCLYFGITHSVAFATILRMFGSK